MVTGLRLLLVKSGNWELNQVQSSDPNRERGEFSDLSSRRRWAALSDNFAVSVQLVRPTFFLEYDGAVNFCRYAIRERQARHSSFYCSVT
jgi:hypothetical protein